MLKFNSTSFLSNWMGQLLPLLGASPLLELSLPGTHDTLTYDLSTTVSEVGYLRDGSLLMYLLFHPCKDGRHLLRSNLL